MQNRYLVHIDPPEEKIEHAQSAATRRLNYDAAKRRERYLRDRDAGKTGYKGIQARTVNPYGNYASLYYNPEKAAEYYQRHKKTVTPVKLSSGTKTTTTNQVGSTNGGSSGGSSSGSGGSGGSSGSAAANRAIQDKIQKLKENSRFETAAQRKATQLRIEQMRKTLAKKLAAKQKEREKVTEKGAKERQDLQDQASADIERAKNAKTENIEKDKKEAKAKKEQTVKPYREENAALRAQLDSMGKSSDPKKRAQLMRQLARNNEKINKANADYTDALFQSKTKHTNTMRNDINVIRTKLYNAKASSSAEQRTKVAEIRSDIAKLRDDNRQEIQNAKAKLNDWISKEKTRVGKETARLKGVKWTDPAKEAAKYDKRVTARAKEILSGGKSTSSKQKTTSKATSGSKSTKKTTRK